MSSHANICTDLTYFHSASTKEEEPDKLLDCERDLLVLNVDEVMRGEEMECDDEEQESERAKTVFSPGQPRNREQ